ncbi:TPA: HAMP domain-containing histidine kinase [Candidatus Poribacteria bacterium]|nr:HAMP domain-containing histidine kinase [Candidatus Poribacteria bacterium]HEX30152.1 HAMP domain-containing histidine kinase [Candidatus Poribacteria bacterium]
MDDFNRRESSFISDMTHEMRTPLTSIIALSDAILQGLMGEVNGEVQAAVEMIHKNAQHLLKLVNDVLDISRIDSGKVKVEIGRCYLPEFIANTVRTVEPMARKKGIDLRFRLDPSLKSILTDTVKLRQILLNLLSNAIKFTERGYVELRCEPSDNGRWIEFSVIDTGPGIEEEDIGKLFKEFVQLIPEADGYGLGLSISRRLARLMGGDIEVESKPGKGSKFTLKLPLEVPDEQVG